MKRIFYFLLTTIISGVNIANAQFDIGSKGVLDKVSSNYQSFKTIEADILLSVESRHAKEHTSNTGKLFLERASGKFKIELGGQVIISDGTTQWTVLKDQGEVQINNADRDNNSLSPATIFTFYKTGYKGTSTGTSKVANKTLATIALVPTDVRQNVSRIDLRVDKATHLIYDATVFDKNGSKYTYTIKKITINKPLSTSLFTFNKSNYPKLEIVDLR
jgi:outer membrane lipoprotein-sorting protein